MRYSISNGVETPLRDKIIGGSLALIGVCLVAVPVVARLQPDSTQAPAVLSSQDQSDGKSSGTASNGQAGSGSGKDV